MFFKFCIFLASYLVERLVCITNKDLFNCLIEGYSVKTIESINNEIILFVNKNKNEKCSSFPTKNKNSYITIK